MAGNSKNFLNPYKIISAGDMSGNITSSVTDIRYADNVSIQFNFTGTPTGTFSVEGSVDYISNPVSGNWVAITLPTTPVATGSAGSILLDLNQLSFPFIRVKYTRTSGSGSVDAIISGKAV